MQNSKLLLLLRSLQPEEIHWFQKFLKSPFYNNNTFPIQLFDHIRKYYPDLDSPKLSKEATFKKLFPKEKLNIQKLRKTMHGLALLVEEFLIAMQVRKNGYQKKKLLVTELGERNVYALFEKKTKSMLKDLEDLPYRDAHFYKEVHELNLRYYGHVETEKEKRNIPILEAAVEHLDYYYLMQRQRLEFSAKWHQRLYGDKKMMSQLLTKSKKNIEKESVFQLYELIIKALSTTKNEELFLEIDSMFKEQISKLSQIDKLEIIRILLNHLSHQVNKGKETYTTKMFALYKFGLEQDLMLYNKQIGDNTFFNIASVGIFEKEFDWVLSFIEKYKIFLSETVRENTVCLSLGLLFFYKEEYEKTIDFISNQSFSNYLQILTSKSILIRTYVHLFIKNSSYFELALDQTHAFEKFVRRHDFISNQRREGYLNFILFTRKLINDILQGSLNQTLYNKVAQADSVRLRAWLLKTIENTLQSKKRPK